MSAKANAPGAAGGVAVGGSESMAYENELDSGIANSFHLKNIVVAEDSTNWSGLFNQKHGYVLTKDGDPDDAMRLKRLTQMVNNGTISALEKEAQTIRVAHLRADLKLALDLYRLGQGSEADIARGRAKENDYLAVLEASENDALGCTTEVASKVERMEVVSAAFERSSLRLRNSKKAVFGIIDGVHADLGILPNKLVVDKNCGQPLSGGKLMTEREADDNSPHNIAEFNDCERLKLPSIHLHYNGVTPNKGFVLTMADNNTALVVKENGGLIFGLDGKGRFNQDKVMAYVVAFVSSSNDGGRKEAALKPITQSQDSFYDLSF